VSEIDSVQNGLFLSAYIRKGLGTEVAFLKVRGICLVTDQSDGSGKQTPNFAMDTTDIDPNAQADTERCSAHLSRITRYSSVTPGSSQGLHSGLPTMSGLPTFSLMLFTPGL
jgi:hypothetical protein